MLAIEPESGIVDFGAVVYQEGEKDYLTREVLVKNQDKSTATGPGTPAIGTP